MQWFHILGAGVGQGFEDTYALCRILAHPKVTKDSLNVRNLSFYIIYEH